MAIHVENEGRYGVDRIAASWRAAGTGRAAAGPPPGAGCWPALRAPRPYAVTTVQDAANSAGLVNLVGRDFVPPAKDQLWYGDITYIFTLAGWAYLATVIDGYSRKVVGWSVADHMVRNSSWMR